MQLHYALFRLNQASTALEKDQPFSIISDQSCSMFSNDSSGSAEEMLYEGIGIVAGGPR